MSIAYICDKCGVVVYLPSGVHGIWTQDEFFYKDAKPYIHLCDECYAEFVHVFRRNLVESGGDAE